MPNRLAEEKSPYLLQHADNPVDWFPWGEAAREKARAENKPIFLSVGYATCHWCHVMAHESFEDDEVAGLLNESWVAVKVDREERPDVDQVYMAACQALTGQGGWPLSVFMTPEGRPFYAGTYFPKTTRYGRPGFMELLRMLAEKWQTEEEAVRQAAEQLTQALQDPPEVPADNRPGGETLEAGYRQLSRSHDPRNGGFGKAPKFPTPHNLSFLLRWHDRHGDPESLEMVEKTLSHMRRGGIYDHLGYGFHRYSVDERWLAPHFEKMLYDQALLLLAYVEAYQVTGKEVYARTAREITAYVLRDMTAPEGGFHAAEDADSEGREGKFYVWRPGEVKAVLGDELGEQFCRHYDVTEDGNFEEGDSILHTDRPLEPLARWAGLEKDDLAARFEEARRRLFEHREKRVRPIKDDKVVTAWNGLMIAAMARAGAVLDDADLVRAAARAAEFILTALKTGDGRLYRRWREGEAAHSAFVEDYAFLAWGLIELYEAGFDAGHLAEALALTGVMLDRFWDDENGGLFFTDREGEDLVARKKEVYDGALPSGNSVAALNLLRLARMTGRTEFEDRADGLLRAFASTAARYPMAHTFYLNALDFAIGPGQEIVIAGDPADDRTRELIRTVRSSFRPGGVLLVRPEGGGAESLAEIAPFTAEMGPVDGQPALYLCRDFTCRRPVTDPAEAARLLDE